MLGQLGETGKCSQKVYSHSKSWTGCCSTASACQCRNPHVWAIVRGHRKLPRAANLLRLGGEARSTSFSKSPQERWTNSRCTRQYISPNTTHASVVWKELWNSPSAQICSTVCSWDSNFFFFPHVFTLPESCQLGETWFCKVKRHCLVCLCKLAFWSVVSELECRALPVLVECKACHACALGLGQKEN